MPVRCLFFTVVLALFAGCPSRTSGPALPDVALPTAILGAPYLAELTATGGTEPHTYSVEGLPPGFSFYTGTAVLEGAARQVGTWRVKVSVADADGRTDERVYPLTVELDEGDGRTAHLTIANWNLEWFGSTEYGPVNEPLQSRNAAAVITSVRADIWALNEIISATAFEDLIADASSRTSWTYEGLLSNAPDVRGGSASYDPLEHKVALVWRSGVLSDVSAEIILGSHDHAFGGRPPLKVEATATIDGVSVPLTLVVLHMKAFDDEVSYRRRRDAGIALKRWLDALPDDREVIVLGDWNDDLDVSISIPRDTPFRELVDSPRYTFVTEVLSQNDITTHVSYPTPIDHQLVTAPLAARHVSGSTGVVRPAIDRYGQTTSDHYPVRSTFLLGPREADEDAAEGEAPGPAWQGWGAPPVTSSSGSWDLPADGR